MISEIAQRNVAELRRGLRSRIREQHLTAVADGKQARESIQRRAEIIAVALLGLADVERNANRDAAFGRKRFRLQNALNRVSRLHGIGYLRKRRAERIADSFENVAFVRFDLQAHECVVASHVGGHCVRVAFPERGTRDDIREKKSDAS